MTYLQTSGTSSNEDILDRARQRAGSYEWKAAAELCESVLSNSAPLPTIAESALAQELLAECHFKNVFQSENRYEFRKRMSIVAERYGQLANLNAREGNQGSSKRLASLELFARFWLESEAGNKDKILVTCIELSNESAEIFRKEGNKRGLLMTCRDLMTYFREALLLSTEWAVLKSRFEAALTIGRASVSDPECRPGDEYIIEALHFIVWLLATLSQVVALPSEIPHLREEAKKMCAQLSTVSARMASPWGSYLSKEAAALVAFDLDGDYLRAIELAAESQASATKLKDSLLEGRSLWSMSRISYWMGLTEEDAEKRGKELRSGMDSAMRAIEVLRVPFPTTDLAAAHASCADCHTEYANTVEKDRARKKIHLQEAIEIATKGVSYENGTLAWSRAAHALCTANFFASALEESNRRETLLQDSLSVRKEVVRVTDLLLPHFWNRVTMRNYLALLKSELASLENSQERKIQLLNEAVSDMEECMALGSRWATSPGLVRRLADYSESFGDILYHLHSLTLDPATARKAIEVFETSINYLEHSNQLGAIAPIRWKTARTFDGLGEFEAASEAFKRASEEYVRAGKAVQGAAPTFEDLAKYMDAWYHTEIARSMHLAGEYAVASAEYAQSAKTLEATIAWSSLSRLFRARSLLENGEAASREEKHDSSVICFKSAAEQFREARAALEARLTASSEPIEQRELRDWLTATTNRGAYCECRAKLEEAKRLDKDGEKTASARKYQAASEGFRILLRETNAPQDPRELETLARFCDAWGRMKEAESESSAQLYSEAAKLFLHAKEGSPREVFQQLALANSSICRALEAGTRFRETRDLGSYSEVKRHLESAADYYRDGGFGKTENWTRATQRLFDALVYLSEAETEKDPRKKTELYNLAEKHLELAAKLYSEAGFPKKRREALDRLEHVREAKQVLVAALESLSQIPIVSSTVLTPISLARGTPFGLERFDEAFVVGDMTVSPTEVPVGSDVTVELDIANVGKTPATLVKLQSLASKGLAMSGEKNQERVEGDSLDLHGKRLEHLKTHTIAATLTANQSGTYELQPRVFFTDDRGNYRSFQFHPAHLNVLELSVPETATNLALEKVAPRVTLPDQFRFETERARKVFQFLVNEFVRDYVSKRLHLDEAGWRSFVAVVRELKIPRSSFYGPQGRVGPVLAELERRGIVETRIFPKERGRGGSVRRVRVAYGNAVIKSIVERAVMESR